MACCRDRFEAWALFWTPASALPEWLPSSGLLQKARSLPGLRVREDREGRIARIFQARTSGQTLLYSAAGTLAFRGGVTPARGHAGDNAGGDAIRAILLGQLPLTRSAPVFGCALYVD